MNGALQAEDDDALDRRFGPGQIRHFTTDPSDAG